MSSVSQVLDAQLELRTNCSDEWNKSSPTTRSCSPCNKVGEAIFNDYLDLIKSGSNINNEGSKQSDHSEKPYDFFDDDEFAFGINLLNNNVACVGDNLTKLIQLAQEPWPDNVKLFQPYEVEQILLPDNASCLAVQAFLKMCNLPFEVEMRWNAEFMSPSGRVPFIKCGAFVVSELEPIAQFAANKGVSLCARLSTEEKAEMRAYMSLITNVLVNAELYISWIDNDTFNQVTKVRNSSVYPWPLGWLQTRAKRNNVAKRLKALHWHDKTLDQVLADVEQCCNSLSQRLGEKDYFFGTPTPLDALVYGHIRALLSAQGPKAALMIRPITTALLQHVIRVATLVAMRFTPQEEYLLHEAFAPRRRLSPARSLSERSSRARRSRLSVRRQSAETISRDVLGKPFASKKLKIMSNKQGSITCMYDEVGRFGLCEYIDEDEYNLMMEIIEDIFDKVEEVVLDRLSMKLEADKHNFEVIAFPNQGGDSKNESQAKLDEGLETLEDVTDNSISIDDYGDDMVQVQNDEVVIEPEMNQDNVSIDPEVVTLNSAELDNDGVAIEKPVEITSPSEESNDNENFHTPELTDSRPTELDALVFGHVFTIITTRLPCRRLADVVRKHEALVALAKRVDEQYFKRP